MEQWRSNGIVELKLCSLNKLQLFGCFPHSPMLRTWAHEFIKHLWEEMFIVELIYVFIETMCLKANISVLTLFNQHFFARKFKKIQEQENLAC